MNRSPTQAMTLAELLICITIGVVFLGLLAILLLPPHSEGLRGQMTQRLSNLKQLHLATQQMVLDGITTGDTNLPDWTCRGTNPITFREWTNLLVENNYLSATDMEKLLSASFVKETRFSREIVKVTNAVVVFAVTDNDPGDTLFLASHNWKGLATLGVTPSEYPTNGFVVFRKGGDGAILLTDQSTATNLIGSGGMHNFLPLR